MGDEFVAKYSNLVWKCVHTFCLKTAGFGNTALIDKDDLYQECITSLLDSFIMSGKSLDDYRFSAMDINNIICRYVLHGLPVSVPATRTTDYSKLTRKYANTESVGDNIVDRSENSFLIGNDDTDFAIDYHSFTSTLDDKDRKVFVSLINGVPHAKIMSEMNISRQSLRYMQRRLARAWNNHMQEDHMYYGRMKL